MINRFFILVGIMIMFVILIRINTLIAVTEGHYPVLEHHQKQVNRLFIDTKTKLARR